MSQLLAQDLSQTLLTSVSLCLVNHALLGEPVSFLCDCLHETRGAMLRALRQLLAPLSPAAGLLLNSLNCISLQPSETV